MIVMKFGGTSIQDEACLQRAVDIIQSRLKQRPVLVFSAMGKTTRELLEMARLAASGKFRDAEERLETSHQYHGKLAESVVPNFDESKLKDVLQNYFKEIRNLLSGLCTLSELPSSSQDRILSYGELLSTSIMSELLNQHGVKAEWLDSREFIITDERHTMAEPVGGEVESMVRKKVLPALDAKKVPVIQGFIGASREGAATTLGFEGSDFTAALVGAALEVSEIQVWKDVPGIMTADPSVLDDVRIVKNLSFDEASELARFGAKILHPRSIGPARGKGIPVRICHTAEPDAAGTLISSESRTSKNVVTSITYKRSLVLLRMTSSEMVSSYDFLKSVFDILERERVMPLAVSTAGPSVLLAVDASSPLHVLVDDLGHFGRVEIQKEKASVTMVGQGLRARSDFLPTLFQHLKGVKVDLVSHGASSISTTLIVDDEAMPSVLNKIHRYLFP